MPDTNMPFSNELRSEYDSELLDLESRRRNATRLRRALDLAGIWKDSMKILDVGGGTGLLLSFLDEGNGHKFACDLRREPFLLSRNRLPWTIHFSQSDGCALPFQNTSFDLVLNLAVIGEFPDWQQALKEMGRCVALDGVLYVTVANGPMLSKLYSIGDALGIHARDSWKAYAKACTRLFVATPEEGMGVLDMYEWEFLDLTSLLIQSHLTWLKYIPGILWKWFAHLFAPSYGYAWRKRHLPKEILEK